MTRLSTITRSSFSYLCPSVAGLSIARANRRRSKLAHAAVAPIELLEGRRLLSAVVVNSISDTATGSGIVTLRDAVATADSSTSPTTITFDPTVFATAQTIVLNGTQLELSNTGEPTTITGPTAGVTLSGNNASRIFYIDQNVTAAMSGMTFTNGAAVTAGFPADRGGAIENYGGFLQVTDSLFVNNTALSYGGAINEDFGSVTLINDTLTGNTVTGTSPDGPGCGGGISVEGAVVLNGVTITDNTAQDGGGMCANIASGETFSLANTIVAGNVETVAGEGDGTGVENETGVFVSLGNNLIGNTAGSSGWIGSDHTGTSSSPLAAGLGSLANNGGPTETLLPQAGSPAIGAGSVALVPSGVTTDQRGMPRTINGAVDIGAVEVGGLVNDSPLVPTISGRLPSKPLVAGGKISTFSQIVRVTNSSSSPISDEIMVSLLLSNDPSGAAGGTSTASVMHKLTNLKPGKFVNVRVAVHSLPASPVGSLYILPEVTDPSGDTAFSASTGTISVAAPFIDLQPLRVRAPASVKAGEARPVIVTLINNGNSAASGFLAIDLQASTDGSIDSTSIDLGTITRPNVVIKPGKKLVVALSETFPSTGGPYYIVANVDPNNTFNESTLANNVLSSVTTVKLI